MTLRAEKHKINRNSIKKQGYVEKKSKNMSRNRQKTGCNLKNVLFL
jgi:hypothetical protein